MILSAATAYNNCNIAQLGLTDKKKYRSFILVVLSLVVKIPRELQSDSLGKKRIITSVNKLELELEEFLCLQCASCCCVVDGIIGSFEINCTSLQLKSRTGGNSRG